MTLAKLVTNWITGLSLWKDAGLIHDAQRYVGHGSISEVGMAIAGGVAQLWNQGISNQHEPHIVRCGWWYNSLKSNDAYMSHQPRPSLVQIIGIIWTNGVLLSIRPL